MECVSSTTSELNLSEFAMQTLYHVLDKIRYMFYLAWPSETMYPSLDVVPRYVVEVSETVSNCSYFLSHLIAIC